ncbi:MAG TPA: glycosyltransferase family 1 protein [Thermoanaerobaculia bacterium]|jgi:hypothetical protein|nr:glycosyltransferase family 1 protein [Thermoanaerobaculia bacterium]
MSGGGALREVVQVVPRLPPPAEGLGGYALALAGALREQHGVASRFVAAASTPSAGALCDLLDAAPGLPVLLQYSGYGYQVRGCPVWLVDGLEAWKRGSPDRRLVTFFHEVHAMGPPWRSSFWTSPVQRRLAARLTRLSDATATSLDLYAGLLRRWGPRRDPVVLPVVSNVGEPEPAVVPLLSARPPRLVVFGGAGNRSKVYGRHLAELAAVCRALAVREVADVGPPIALPAALPSAIGEIPIVRLGLLSEAEASAALLASRAGFLAYPASFLGKSGVLAAYAAHGVAPVCTTAAPPASGLTAGVHYLPAAQILRGADSQADLQPVADAARAWYAGHALRRHADLLSGLLACAS